MSLPTPFDKGEIVGLGTEKSLLYNMAGAKRNGAATFIEANINGAVAFYELKMKFEVYNVLF